jgi:tetraacyldisaccharide-1-P 4'-kinase
MQIEKWNRTTTLQPEKPEVILLDDASAPVKAGFYILLTSYDDLYSDDWILPTGNLCERSGALKGECNYCNKVSCRSFDRGTKGN